MKIESLTFDFHGVFPYSTTKLQNYETMKLPNYGATPKSCRACNAVSQFGWILSAAR